MSFIRGITEDAKKQAMVRSIVEFANSCGMSTCLEGVETEELQNYLRIYKATWFQGYYYSRPIEIRKFREMVQAFGGKRNQKNSAVDEKHFPYKLGLFPPMPLYGCMEKSRQKRFN